MALLMAALRCQHVSLCFDSFQALFGIHLTRVVSHTITFGAVFLHIPPDLRFEELDR
jgi:hypothetical protein